MFGFHFTIRQSIQFHFLTARFCFLSYMHRDTDHIRIRNKNSSVLSSMILFFSTLIDSVQNFQQSYTTDELIFPWNYLFSVDRTRQLNFFWRIFLLVVNHTHTPNYILSFWILTQTNRLLLFFLHIFFLFKQNFFFESFQFNSIRLRSSCQCWFND